jgi:hypothetical protein
MTRTFSTFVLATLRAGAFVSVVPLLSGLGLAQKVVTARATIPFKLGTRPQVPSWGLCLRQRGAGVQLRSTVKEQTQVIGVSIMLYTVPREKDNASVVLALRDGKYYRQRTWR